MNPMRSFVIGIIAVSVFADDSFEDRLPSPKVVPFIVEERTLLDLDIYPGDETWFQIIFTATPDELELHREVAERLWWIQDQGVLLLGATGMPLPGVVLGRAEAFVHILFDGQEIAGSPFRLSPQIDAISVGPHSQGIQDALAQRLVSMDASYLSEVANYLASNLTALTELVAGSYSVQGTGTVIDDTGRFVGNAVEIQDAPGEGVHVNNAAGHGVRVEVAAHDGFYVQEAGEPSAFSAWPLSNNGFEVAGAGGHGVFVGHADENGFYVRRAVKDGVNVRRAGYPSYIVSSHDSDGVEIQGAEGNGVSVGRADDNGLYVSDAGNDGVEVSSAGDDGVFVKNAGDDGFRVANAVDQGLRVNLAGGDGIHIVAAGDASHNYGVYTNDNLYSLNYHSKGAQMQVVQYQGNGPVSPGDPVSFSGVIRPAETHDVPTVLVSKTQSGNEIAVAGVVFSRYDLKVLAAKSREEDTPLKHRPLTPTGMIQPGDAMLIVTRGPARVRVDAIGDHLEIGDGIAFCLEKGAARRVGSMPMFKTGDANPVFAKALEPLSGRDAQIWAYVCCQ